MRDPAKIMNDSRSLDNTFALRLLFLLTYCKGGIFRVWVFMRIPVSCRGASRRKRDVFG